MSEKRLMKIARVLSIVFSPFYTPVWILIVLFFNSYLQMLPIEYRLFLLFTVFIFTVFIPRLGINIFRMVMSWTHMQLSHREHRHMPYLLTICSYTVCLVVLSRVNVVMFVRGVVMAAFVSQIICVFINAWWKVSTHMVGMGGMVGALIAFSNLFYFNPMWYVCALILLSGALGTSRIILRQHSLAQVIVGFIIGFVCSLVFILLAWM
ncbi:MAG: hypothetical protein J6X74_04045 [Bacteroidaceae bacterium]|nr:hypothetical protein [Bacteroidaceae bacterium]